MNDLMVKEESPINSPQSSINYELLEPKNEPLDESNWTIVWIKEERGENIDISDVYNKIELDNQVDIGPHSSTRNAKQKSINGTGIENFRGGLDKIETPMQGQDKICPKNNIINEIELQEMTTDNKNNKRKYKFKNIPSHIRELVKDAEEKLYTCKYCQTPFTRESKLMTHIKTHTGNNPYQCRKRLSKNNSLEAKILENDQSNSYKCSSCDMFFDNMSNRKIHMQSQHKEKLYKCKYCDKKFLQDSSMKTHMVSHIEKPNIVQAFSCLVCNKGFDNKNKLETHLRYHNKMKSFNCSLCDVGYIIRNLITGNKPYQCSHCGKTFAEKLNLLKHHDSHIIDKSNCSK